MTAMDAKTLKHIVGYAQRLAREFSTRETVKELQDRLRNSDTPISELYAEYFDAPASKRDMIMSRMEAYRSGLTDKLK